MKLSGEGSGIFQKSRHHGLARTVGGVVRKTMKRKKKKSPGPRDSDKRNRSEEWQEGTKDAFTRSIQKCYRRKGSVCGKEKLSEKLWQKKTFSPSG